VIDVAERAAFHSCGFTPTAESGRGLAAESTAVDGMTESIDLESESVAMPSFGDVCSSLP
jgi:hypothetical protein